MYERYIKRGLDVIFAVIALPIVLVVCIIFGILIWLEDRGTIFYLAKRRGKDGTIFNMYKLRSMKVNAPDIRNKDNSTFNSADDPRVTKIGKLMRKISVDELPQVFNILKGDMSWIGPRPVTTDRPLNNCAVNVDLILRDNKVYVIELTGRVGANCLPELVEINFGIEYYKMIAAMAVGENPLEYWGKRNSKTTAGLARMILSTEESGTLEDIKYTGAMDEDILEITFFKKPGEQIRKFVFSADCIGQIIVKASRLDECREKINKIMSNIEIKLK